MLLLTTNFEQQTQIVGVLVCLEDGSNNGSNLGIYRYSDAGSILSTPFQINMRTGNVAIETPTNIYDNLTLRNKTGTVTKLSSTHAKTSNATSQSFFICRVAVDSSVGGVGIEGTIQIDHYLTTYSGGSTIIKFLAAYKKTLSAATPGTVSILSTVNAGDGSINVALSWSGDTLLCTCSNYTSGTTQNFLSD